MFCRNCGQEINENAVICPHCGVATDKMADVTGNNPHGTEAKKTNVCAIIGFVLSLVSGVFSYIPFFGSYVSWAAFIAAFILSIMGIFNANKKGQNLKGLAIAGLVICCVDLVMNIIALIFVLWVIGIIAGAV